MMLAGAVLCAAASVFLAWQITATGDVSNEWMIWVFVLLGFGLFAVGYLSESKYKREHPDEFKVEGIDQ